MYTITSILKAKDYANIFGVHRNTAQSYYKSDIKRSCSPFITAKIFCQLNGFTLDELNEFRFNRA